MIVDEVTNSLLPHEILEAHITLLSKHPPEFEVLRELQPILGDIIGQLRKHLIQALRNLPIDLVLLLPTAIQLQPTHLHNAPNTPRQQQRNTAPHFLIGILE